jgi:hypothetical protein
MKTIFSLLLCILITAALRAQTYVSGGIYNNTTWTLSNSPYIVTGDIVVFPGATLLVEPGVTVKFDTSTTIEIRGKLNAIGTASDSIFFTSNYTPQQAGDWYGIRTNGDSVNFNYCKFEYADKAIVQGSGRLCTLIKNSSFRFNNIGVGYTDMHETVEDCHFESNFLGIEQTYKISGCTFYNNYGGVQSVFYADSSTFCGNWVGIGVVFEKLEACIITFSDVAVEFQGDTAINNIIFDNRIGMKYCTNAGYAAGNALCRNTGYNFVNCSYDAIITGNCWCDWDSANVAATIFDGYDDISLGVTDFIPSILCDTNALPANVNCGSFGTGVNERSFSDLTILIYPNPAYSSFIVKVNAGFGKALLRILSPLGELVYAEPLRGGEEYVIQSSLAPGFYIVSVSTEKQKTTAKLVISE